ncbi:MAG: alkaline phosphatase family protein [Lacunisphaera sp.]|jgi:hypothetical protein|nr:alkaline phosphatase family protein [Lacunisphaera sp.]
MSLFSLLRSGLISLVLSACAAAQVAPPPRLVVVISVDQMRADYLDRFRPYFGPGGFKLLLDQGANFANCHYRHSITKTGPGHAVILSGVHANIHGIIANEWLLRAEAAPELVNCVEDRDSALVGQAPRAVRSPGGVLEAKSGRSPRHYLAATVGDQLKLRHGARAKVFGVADKDRAAILMSGKLADGAYWTEDGRVVTSTYYRPELPAYLTVFNAEQRAEKLHGGEWTRLLDPSVYDSVQGPDDAPGESKAVGFTSTFPKRLDGGQARIGKDYYDAFDYTPWNNDLIADLARAVITQEQLGEADGSPDLLAIGFSQPDKIGHAYGPDSHEVMDSILRLDRTLAGLFQFLDEKVGLANCNIVLTADHGAAPLPERNPAQGGRVRGADFDQVVYAALDRQFGTLTDNERWAVRDGLGYHLNPAALAQKKISASRLEDAVQAALRSIPAVASAYTRAQLTDPAPLDAMGEALRLSFYPPRSPDVLAVLKPYFIDRAAPGTTHGTPYDYDNHVPLLWYGAGVKSGLHPEQVGVDDLAPTLVRLLGLPPLPQAAGRILF